MTYKHIFKYYIEGFQTSNLGLQFFPSEDTAA